MSRVIVNIASLFERARKFASLDVIELEDNHTVVSSLQKPMESNAQFIATMSAVEKVTRGDSNCFPALVNAFYHVVSERRPNSKVSVMNTTLEAMLLLKGGQQSFVNKCLILWTVYDECIKFRSEFWKILQYDIRHSEIGLGRPLEVYLCKILWH